MTVHHDLHQARLEIARLKEENQRLREYIGEDDAPSDGRSFQDVFFDSIDKSAVASLVADTNPLLRAFMGPASGPRPAPAPGAPSAGRREPGAASADSREPDPA